MTQWLANSNFAFTNEHFELSHFERIFVRKIFRNSIDGQWWTIHVPSMAIDGICNDHLQIGSIGGQAWTIHGHGWNAMESQYGFCIYLLLIRIHMPLTMMLCYHNHENEHVLVEPP